MTQIIQFHVESWQSTQPSVSVRENSTRSFEVEFSAAKNDQAARTVPVRNRMALLEADPRRAKLLQEARKNLSGSELIEKRTLKQLRLNRGLSQEQVAKLMGSTQAQVAKLEAGLPDVRLSTVKKLASALEVNIVDVVKILVPEK